MNTTDDPRETRIFAGYDSAHDGVQSITQSLVAYMFRTNQTPRMRRLPTLADLASFWRTDRTTISKWIETAERDGAIIRHDDDSVELVLTEDSPR